MEEISFPLLLLQNLIANNKGNNKLNLKLEF
jgi:hypothetical protein